MSGGIFGMRDIVKGGDLGGAFACDVGYFDDCFLGVRFTYALESRFFLPGGVFPKFKKVHG